MMQNPRKGSLLLLAVIIICIEAGVVTSMLLIATSGSKRAMGQDAELNSREIAEAALHLSIINLKKATDRIDNDGDGEVDEGIDANIQLLDILIVPLLEGQLGRVGTVNWTPAADTNGNGYPDLDEPGVTPIHFAGGEMIAYTIFSQADGLDNDWDGEVDEGDEAGFVTAIAVGRYHGIVSQTRFTGRFEDVFAPPNSPTWSPDAAMLCGGSLRITGNAGFLGTQADVHANEILNVMGSCRIAGDATGAEGLFLSGAANVQGFTRGDAPRAGIPEIDPLTLKGRADFILKEDGRVYDSNGALIHDTLGNGSFHGWSKGADLWQFNGSGWNPDGGAGTYFIEGNAHLTGTGQGSVVSKHGGGETQTFTMTVIATGSIQMSGNTRIRHHDPDGLLFIAGGDVRLTGTPQLDQYMEGIIAAHEQIHVAGTPEICGALIAQDSGDLFELNTENQVPGTPTITYNGGLNTDLPLLDPENPWFRLDPTILAFEER